jgi:lysophospholipase L1-like esterase
MTYKHLVALGDSLVEGIGDPYPGIEKLSFSERFANSLRYHSPDMKFTNLAKHGATSQNMIDRQLNQASQLEPDLLIMAGGANDTLDRGWNIEGTHTNLDTVLDTFTKQGTTIITFTYANVVSILGDNAAKWMVRTQPRMEAIGNSIRDLSHKYQTIFVDFWNHPEYLPVECWSADGIHGNSLAYLRAARILIEEFSTHTGINLPMPEAEAV